MKQLFGTMDLEAEVFEIEKEVEDQVQETEYILGEGTAEEYAVLDNLQEQEDINFPALELTLELSDGRLLEYEVASVFVHEGKEYIGLHPKSDTDGLIHIMQLLQGEDDEIELLPIKKEEELQAVYNTFFRLYADDYEIESTHDSDEKERIVEGTQKFRRFNVR